MTTSGRRVEKQDLLKYQASCTIFRLFPVRLLTVPVHNGGRAQI